MCSHAELLLLLLIGWDGVQEQRPGRSGRPCPVGWLHHVGPLLEACKIHRQHSVQAARTTPIKCRPTRISMVKDAYKKHSVHTN